MVSHTFSDLNSDLILLRKGMQHRLQRPRHELEWCFDFCFVLTVTQSYGHKRYHQHLQKPSFQERYHTFLSVVSLGHQLGQTERNEFKTFMTLGAFIQKRHKSKKGKCYGLLLEWGSQLYPRFGSVSIKLGEKWGACKFLGHLRLTPIWNCLDFNDFSAVLRLLYPHFLSTWAPNITMDPRLKSILCRVDLITNDWEQLR